MKKFIASVILFSFCMATSFAQLYHNAIGFRISGNSSLGGAGISFKHFLNENSAVEGIFSIKDPVGFGALYQIHKDWNILDNLSWYYGAGGFISFSKPDAGFGLLGNIGVDYKFDQIPLNLAIDWKPEIQLAPKAGVNFNTFGLSLRVVLDKKKN